MVFNSDFILVDHVDLWLIVVMMEDFLIGPWHGRNIRSYNE